MNAQQTEQTTDYPKGNVRNDLKILVLVLAATMVCMGFMWLAGVSASAAAAAWG